MVLLLNVQYINKQKKNNNNKKNWLIICDQPLFINNNKNTFRL